MVVFASLVVGFCSGFLSLFGVVLCELGKKGKPAKGVVRLLRWLGSLRRFGP
jgi:hypothetical protein